MGASVGIYSSLLNGLDIVAITYKSGSQSYPAGARYGIVTGADGGVLLFPLCFKVRISGTFRVHCLAGNGSQVTVASWSFSTGNSTYNAGSANVSITWFG